MILIEGPDCSGKTTLIEEEFGHLNRKHNGLYPSPTHAYNAYLQQISDFLSFNTSIVFDRMHLSEFIYGTVMRDEYTINSEQFNTIEEQLTIAECITVVCLPHLSKCLKTWWDRQDDEYVSKEQKFISIYEYYTCSHNLSNVPVLYYDYTNSSFNEAYPIQDRIDYLRKFSYGS